MPVKIDIDRRRVLAKIDLSEPAKMKMLSEEILADCNEYCKMDTGNLIASSLIHSQLEQGVLVWATPYAKKQYWMVRRASTDKHSLATWRWCEYAKNARLDRWIRQAKRIAGGGDV